MPELPEVETTRRGIEPFLAGRSIQKLVVRQPALRWPVTPELARRAINSRILNISRRGKYLLVRTETGTLIIHLGMSGSLRCLDSAPPPGKHDHIDMRLDNGTLLRYTDPRRFGAWLWTEDDPLKHPLLRDLGPEPLATTFDGSTLVRAAQRRRLAVKSFLMDSHTVVGVGNIYANEALFMAAIHPQRSAGRIGASRYDRLAEAVKSVLTDAIRQGGTTLRDFSGGDGKPGYFRQSLHVYGRTGQPCPSCAAPICEKRVGQRSSFYCKSCQR
ncbi:MAG: bifunctional DNA-formamidopyrimidine glycosylase/DNA-(apurinic or apyrimidinic site) lyase [Thiogranum sp.]|nr:bifunctional DNA-formamidopyrimidine glycosylase/DNA-(apurinic or apyrimidinic site) lyase [Thiogranum sp.]